MKQQMLERRVTELEAEVAQLKQQLKTEREGQSYTYYGKDGKPVLARDLEDERDSLKQQLEDERSGKAWREANGDRSKERERMNS